MSEHTPSPQSVVVPVEPTEEMMLAGALVGPDTNNGQFGYDDARTVFVAMLAAAPAPSSLAGREATWVALDENGSAELRVNGKRITTFPSYGGAEEAANRINAALSPEAPAREGVEPWKEGREEGRLAARPWRKGDPMPAVGTMVLVSGAHGDVESDQHRAFQWRRVIGYGVDGADFICLQNKGCWPTVERMENCWFAALTPRHEAPAEGAVDGMDAYTRHDAIISLRARSSAPEARDGEAWRVERTKHAVKFWVGVQGFTVATRGDDPDGGEHLRLMDKMLRKALSRISAAPSADKLRDHLEWIETVLTDPVPGYTARIATAREYIDQALAALKGDE